MCVPIGSDDIHLQPSNDKMLHTYVRTKVIVSFKVNDMVILMYKRFSLENRKMQTSHV